MTDRRPTSSFTYLVCKIHPVLRAPPRARSREQPQPLWRGCHRCQTLEMMLTWTMPCFRQGLEQKTMVVNLVHLWNTMEPFDTWRVRTFSKLYCSGNYPWRSSKRAKPSVFQRQSAAKLKTNPGNPCNKLTASENRSISSTMITLDGFNDASEMIFTCYWWVCSRNVRVLMTKTR